MIGDKKDFYSYLSETNVLRRVVEKGFKLDAHGRVRMPVVLSEHHPWLHAGICPDRHCMRWLYIYHMNFGIIPRNCLGCWKTFYKPQTLRELYEIYKFQQKESRNVVDISAKCGIEAREYTGNLGGYGAFWYNPLHCSIEEARDNTRRLSRALGKELGLKRGCTEMEQFTRRHYGFGSNEWEKTQTTRTEMEEAMLDTVFYFDGDTKVPVDEAQAHDIQQRWIEHAVAHGDMTYLDFVREPLVPKLLNYMESDHGLNTGAKKILSRGNEGKQEDKAVEAIE